MKSPLEEFAKPQEREYVKRLSGITAAEWKTVRSIIDGRFDEKRNELERELKLDCSGI